MRAVKISPLKSWERCWLNFKEVILLCKNKKVILISFVFIILLGLKVGHLAADPPTQLSWSGGLFGDEGAHAHNARNKILFGKWITDDWNPMLYNPFLTLSEYGSFLLLGPGLVPVRLVTVFFSFLGLVLFYFALKRIDFLVALGAVVLLGINYIYLMYSRLGLTDTFMSAALLMAFFFWQKGIEKRKFLLVAGVTSFATYVCKGTAVYFILALVISLFFALIRKNEGKPFNKIIPDLVYFFSGFLAAVIIWFLFFYLPNKTYFSAYGETWLTKAIPGNPERLWQNLKQPKMFYLAKTPLVLLTGLFYLPFFLYALFRNWRKIYPAEFFAWLWWGGGIIFLSGLNYNPIRYFISVIPAFCLVTAFALVRLFKSEVLPARKPKIIFWVLTVIWYTGVIALVYRFFTLKQIISPVLFFIISLFCIFMLYYLLLELNFVFKNKIKLDFSPVKLVVIALFMVSVLTNGYRYFQWFKYPNYTVRDTSRDLGKILDGAYLAGLWAPLLCLENSHRALYLGEGNERETFSRYPVTHLILWDGNNREELRRLQRDYPEVMEKAREIKVYNIKELPVRLFELEK